MSNSCCSYECKNDENQKLEAEAGGGEGRSWRSRQKANDGEVQNQIQTEKDPKAPKKNRPQCDVPVWQTTVHPQRWNASGSPKQSAYRRRQTLRKFYSNYTYNNQLTPEREKQEHKTTARTQQQQNKPNEVR